MKKIFLQCIVTFALLAYYPALAQQSYHSFVYPGNSKVNENKSIKIDIAQANERAVKNFIHEFGQRENEEWYLFQDYLTATFVRDAVKYRIDYDNKGKWIGTTKTYSEKKLPREIRMLVKSQYFDYTITTITEIELPGLTDGPVYVVHIESQERFKNIKVQNKEIIILDEYDKG